MQKRIWLSAPLVALAFMALVATRSEGKLETIEQIIPGVWFRQGDLDQYGHCNNIVIEMKDYLIVVDANYPSGARATMAGQPSRPAELRRQDVGRAYRIPSPRVGRGRAGPKTQPAGKDAPAC
jgi:hypothetical protein